MNITRKQKRTINNLLVMVVVFLIAITAGVVYLVAFHQNPPVEYLNLPFPVDKTEYKAGETIVITLDYCRNTEASYTRNVRFVDSLVFSVPETERGGAEIGCRKVNILSEKIPDSLPPGEYYLSGTNSYHVNILVDRDAHWETEVFTVIE